MSLGQIITYSLIKSFMTAAALLKQSISRFYFCRDAGTSRHDYDIGILQRSSKTGVRCRVAVDFLSAWDVRWIDDYTESKMAVIERYLVDERR